MSNSIHLQNYPESYSNIDYSLIAQMNAVREICSQVLSIRKEKNIKVRIPLQSITIYHKNLDFLESYKDVILNEVNIKEVLFRNDIESVGSEVLKINFKTLGPKIGDKIKSVIQDSKAGKYTILDNGNIEISEVEISKSDFTLEFNMADSSSDGRFSDKLKCVVLVNTHISDELLSEGVSRDFVRIVQQDRKEMDLKLNQRISVDFECGDEQIISSILKHQDYIKSQCLINTLNHTKDIKSPKTHNILDKDILVTIYV